MSNLITTSDVMTIAKTFAESGMFQDTKQVAQAFVKIQAGQEIGLPPFASMTGIHIIQGKPTLGAGLIASRVKGSGKYDYKVVEMTDANCSIDFYQGKEKIGNSSFSIAEAKKAGTKNIDKFPKNMLFARAISNGVKWFCPDVFSGPVYTPEEMQEVTEDISHTEVLNEIESAVLEMEIVANMDDLKQIWSKYKNLQTNPDFVAAKDKRKAELTEVNEPETILPEAENKPAEASEPAEKPAAKK